MRLFRDVAAITQDLGTIETRRLRTLGGADKVTVGQLTGTDLDPSSPTSRRSPTTRTARPTT